MTLHDLTAQLRHRRDHLRHLAGQVAFHSLPLRGAWRQWTNNPGQARVGRRMAYNDPRQMWRIPGELDPVVVSSDCRCGAPLLEHLHPRPRPEGCTGYRIPHSDSLHFEMNHLRPQVSTWSIRYPIWVGYLRGRANTAARRWLDAHVRPWINSADVEAWMTRPLYSVEAYVARYRDEATGWPVRRVTGATVPRRTDPVWVCPVCQDRACSADYLRGHGTGAPTGILAGLTRSEEQA